MKSKSYIKGPYLDLIAEKQIAYCEVIAESYYKTGKNGIYSESAPNTTEILNDWFKPLVNAFILKNNYFFIGEWCTGILFDSYTGPDGVTTERLIFKPTENTGNAALAKQEYLKVYKLTHLKKRKNIFNIIVDNFKKLLYNNTR